MRHGRPPQWRCRRWMRPAPQAPVPRRRRVPSAASCCLIFDLRRGGTAPAAVGAALGLTLLEAEQRVRRRGLLSCTASSPSRRPPPKRRVCARPGCAPDVIAERRGAAGASAAAGTRRRVARRSAGLDLGTPSRAAAAWRSRPAISMLVVRGPIAREYSRGRGAAPRAHGDARARLPLPPPPARRGVADPIEIDPATFDFRRSDRAVVVAADARRLDRGSRACGGRDDDAFRREPPALGLAEPARTDARRAAAHALAPPRAATATARPSSTTCASSASIRPGAPPWRAHAQRANERKAPRATVPASDEAHRPDPVPERGGTAARDARAPSRARSPASTWSRCW